MHECEASRKLQGTVLFEDLVFSLQLLDLEISAVCGETLRLAMCIWCMYILVVELLCHHLHEFIINRHDIYSSWNPILSVSPSQSTTSKELSVPSLQEETEPGAIETRKPSKQISVDNRCRGNREMQGCKLCPSYYINNCPMELVWLVPPPTWRVLVWLVIPRKVKLKCLWKKGASSRSYKNKRFRCSCQQLCTRCAEVFH